MKPGVTRAMTGIREIRWKIDAFTAETMPLGRLSEYLKELADMLGDEQKLHLIKVESGTTVPVLRVDDIDMVHERAAAITSGIAPAAAMRSYRNINRMLREDKTSALLFDGTAEIIPFPGKEAVPNISGVREQGRLDGTLIKIGGAKDWVPIQLQTLEGEIIAGCYTQRSTAKDMGTRLFEPIRVFGRGRWCRMPEGKWELERFWVDSFEPLDATPLLEIVAALRSVNAKWQPNPVANYSDSNGAGEDE